MVNCYSFFSQPFPLSLVNIHEKIILSLDEPSNSHQHVQSTPPNDIDDDGQQYSSDDVFNSEDDPDSLNSEEIRIRSDQNMENSTQWVYSFYAAPHFPMHWTICLKYQASFGAICCSLNNHVLFSETSPYRPSHLKEPLYCIVLQDTNSDLIDVQEMKEESDHDLRSHYGKKIVSFL